MRGWARGAAWLASVVLAGCEGCAGRDEPRLATGALEPSTSRVAFGATTLGVPVERGLSLVQRGLLPADVTNLTVTPDDGTFVPGLLPGRVGLDDETPLSVVFAPVEEGTHVATLRVELDRGPPVEITLEGRGVDARVTALEEPDFGRPALGAVRRRSLRLRNAFETAVPVRLAFEGRDAAEFEGAAPLVVTPFAEVELPLTWRPLHRPGPRDVAVVLGPCPLCDDERLAVHAEAVPTPFEIVPDPIAFGGVGIDASRTLEVRVTNATDALVRVERLALGEGADPGFALEGPATPLLLGDRDTVALQVRFTPTRLGPAHATLELRSDAEPDGARDVPIDGVGGGTQLVVVPTQLDFPPVPVGARRVARVVVANGGADPTAPPLKLLGLRVEGPGFGLARGPAAGTALAAGERVEVEVAFEPAAEGPATGALTVESDDPGAPAFVVPLAGSGAAAAACALTVQPEALDFGHVRAGKGAALGFRVTNTGSDACVLWDGRVEGDPAFELTRDRGTVLLAPGGFVYLPVAFRPPAEGRRTASVVYDTNRPNAPRLVLPVAGGSVTTCLRGDPAYVSFGPVRLDCGPVERVAAWRNTCSRPVEVTGAFLGEGADLQSFRVLAAPALPRVLAPDERLEVPVGWVPSVPGYTSRPLFARAADASLPVLVTLSADVRADALHEELRVQPAPGKVDVLWVVDNTASMEDERDALARAITRFVADADARSIDYRIFVTTTGVGPPPVPNGETCPGGADGAESGRLFPVDGSRQRMVHPGLADRVDVLARNLDVGGCHSVEQPLRAAELALDDGVNPGFVRDDAHLAVVVVSDEDDESPEAVDRHVRGLRRARPTHLLTFAAFVAPPGGCPGAVEPALRTLEAARLLGGLVAEVCAPEQSPALEALADALFRPVVRWPLEAPAEPSTLEVTVDGRPAFGWRYESAVPAVVFDTPPPPGSRLLFRYREPCP